MAKKIIKARMQQRIDTLANWASENPVLLQGELGLVSDDLNAYKVGDGVTAWNDLQMRGWSNVNITQTTGDSATDVMSQKGVTQALDKLKESMVEKVPGKGLSTEDYTPEEKRKLTELSDEVGKKADAVGTYLEFTAGRSIDMLGVHEGDDSEFLFRPTDGEGSIKDGEAVVERIEGNSVVWNQMLKNDDISNTINGLTITNNGDGSWTANGTPSADVWLVIDQHPFASVVGHKYLLYGCPKGGSVGTYCLYEAQGRLSAEEGNGSISAVNSTELRPYILVRSGVVCNNLVFRPRVVDLTKMFGAGYEPLTLEEFYQRIPSGVDLNAYNEGEIVDCKVQGIKSVGFNAWDEQWELGYIDTTTGKKEDYGSMVRNKNLIPILPNAQYFANVANNKGDNGYALFYDKEGNYLGFAAMGGTDPSFQKVNTPTDARYINFFLNGSYGSTYNHDVCINLVHTGYRNGEYEPYKESEVALPILNYFPNGMRSIGSVCDEITQKQTIQRIGAVDLGQLDWNPPYNGVFISYVPNMKSDANVGVGMMAQYNQTSLPNGAYLLNNVEDMAFCTNGGATGGVGSIGISDSRYTDAESFKAAMKGVILYYELAEPIVTDIEPMLLSYEAWDFGTEQAIAEQPTAPIKASIVYGFNARDTIRNNRNSIEELTRRITILEQMLGVMAAQAQAVNFVE